MIDRRVLIAAAIGGLLIAPRQGEAQPAVYRLGVLLARVADETIADANAAGLWPGPVVTEVAPARAFWQAEPEHQDYLERHPHGYTRHFVRPGWKLPGRARSTSA